MSLVYAAEETVESGATCRLPLFGGGLGRDGGVLVAEATTNQNKNPRVAEDVTGYSIVGTGTTRTRVTDEAYVGEASLEVVTPGNAVNEGIEYGVGQSVAGTPSVPNTTSAVVKFPLGVQFFITLNERTAADSNVGVTVSGTFTGTGDWQMVSVTRTFGATGELIRSRIQVNGTQAVTFHVGAWQIEAKAYATPYCDGSLGDGFAWTGTAHASSSTRAAGVLTIPVGALSGDEYTVLLWFRAKVASVDLPNSTYLLQASGDGPDRVEVFWSTTNGVMHRRYAATSTSDLTLAASWDADDVVFLACAGDAAKIYLAKDDDVAWTSTDNANQPALTSVLRLLHHSSGLQANAVLLAAAIFDRVLTDAERLQFQALDHVPYAGEIVGRDMTAVLRGFESEAA